MFSKVFLAVLAQSLSVYAATHQVDVGQNGMLTFVPNTINAQPGDIVQYNFQTANHSVVSSTLNNPCSPGGSTPIFSQFQPVTAGKANPQFNVPVTSTAPTYIYCSQTQNNHCQAGMVMIINPPSGAISQMIANAKKSGTSTSPNTGITGGTIVNNAAGTKPSPSAKAKAGTAGAKAAASAAPKKRN